MRLFQDKFSIYKKADEPLYKTPGSVQECIELVRISESGIFEVSKNRYSKSYLFTDVNYNTTSEAEQVQIFESYCKFLNAMDVEFKVTINNKNKNMKTLREKVLFSKKGDGNDKERECYNRIMEKKIMEGKQGTWQERYLTVSLIRKNYEEAKAAFANLEAVLQKAFGELGSGLTVLNGVERLRILHDFYRMGEEEAFAFDFEEAVRVRRDYKDDICNSRLKFYPTYMEDEKKFAKVLFIKKYPSSLSDRFLTELATVPAHTIISIDVAPIPKDVTTSTLQKKYMGIESDIIRQQRVRNKNNDFSSDISYNKRTEKQQIEEIMDDVRENDQRLFFVAVTIIIKADTKEELKAIEETLVAIGKRNSCQIEPHYLKQREALNTALPIGVRQVETMRTLMTQSLAVLMPFNVQELYLPGKGGTYYGVNQVSRNILFGNRKRLVNGNGFIFGVPGSGKSFLAKMEMGNVFLNTQDDIIVIDPQHEYFGIAEKFGGQVVVFSTYTGNHINPMALPEDLTDLQGAIAEKGEFLLGICEQCMGESLNSRQKSIIDRCVRLLYQEIREECMRNRGRKEGEKETRLFQQKTLRDYYDILVSQPEMEAKELALSLELFIGGSLNIFAHETNVDMDNRFLVYGIRDMGKELSAISMLVMMENIGNRIMENAKKGKATWLIIDEFHVLLDKEYSAKYLFSLWKKVRKLGGLCTGITQNVIDMLQNYTATTMLANSEFVALLRQAPTDLDKLSEVINISKEQLKFVRNAPSGTGILKHGNMIVPMDITVDKDSPIYQLFSTNPFEEKEAAHEKED
ncbi:MAG: DUF87 domain-containing protein [Lachnospiraceae bacterium]|nr:DUF87 domain-containing protein [Lachnospiraceae bacterium]